jgi:hypothetical protein
MIDRIGARKIESCVVSPAFELLKERIFVDTQSVDQERK